MQALNNFPVQKIVHVFLDCSFMLIVTCIIISRCELEIWYKYINGFPVILCK